MWNKLAREEVEANIMSMFKGKMYRFIDRKDFEQYGANVGKWDQISQINWSAWICWAEGTILGLDELLRVSSNSCSLLLMFQMLFM